MTDLHITDPEPLNDDIVLENSLRPSKFDEFIGQKELVDNLKLYIEAANKRGESLDHVLLFGPPGLGKTTLANIIAKELDVPVIALSQLSRAVETRGGSKRPLLSDLRESGAIEQDADIVSFIFRPEYYGLTEWDDEDGTPCDGQAEFIIAKHRNGGLQNIRLKFIGNLAQIDRFNQIIFY